MKKIPLTKGKVTIVDDQDYEDLCRFKWHTDSKGYAVRAQRINGKEYKIGMHRHILGLKPGDRTVVGDHINRDPLDNRRHNLRAVTYSQNSLNRRLRNGRKGITYHKNNKRWIARLGSGSESERYLGSFLTQEEAAAAYDKAAIERYGKYITTNGAGV